MLCPICKGFIDEYFEVDTDKPFTALSPWEGLTAWGPYDVPKRKICENKVYVHFQFPTDGEHRLVKMLRGGK